MTFLRFLLFLSLGIWIGSIVYFAAVVAPTAFAVLPTRALAGAIVSRSLTVLHWIGLVSGLVFLLSSVIYAFASGASSPFGAKEVLVVLMLAVTAYAHFAIEKRMNVLRTDMGVIDTIPHDDPRRVEFNKLHVWSTRAEGSVLFLGLAALFLASRRLS